MDPIKHIGIIGEGKMGSSLVHYLLQFDYQLSWLCSSGEGEEEALKFFGKKLRVLQKSGVMTEEESTQKNESTTISAVPGALAGCDLVIEAITEDLEAKRQLFRVLDDILKPSCLLVSNSSSILPSEYYPDGKRAEQVAGLHFFFPVNLKKTVELIHGPATSRKTIRALDQFLISIQKKALHENERNAFALNRILLDFQVGAYHVLLEGRMTMKEIDDMVKSRFFSVGIFDFFDQVGIDVMRTSIRNYTRESKNKAFYDPLIHKMEELVSQHRLGFKTKQGFYTYCKTLGAITKEVSPEPPSTEYLQEVENRLLNFYITSVNDIIASGVDAAQLAEAVKDNLGIERDPFRLLIADC